MSEKKVKIMICSVLFSFFLILIILYSFLLNSDQEEDKFHENITEIYKMSEVFNFSEYQNVYDCINNYFITINNDYKGTLNLLFENFKLNNNISNSNINQFVEDMYDFYSYQMINILKYNNPYFSIYYISGNYNKESYEEIIETKVVQHILILDIVNNSYAVIPLLEENESFDTIIKKFDLNDYNQEIEQNSYNLIPDTNVTDFNESMYYYGKFINLLISDCETAYGYLEDNSKKIYPKLSDFRKLCDIYKNKNNSVVIDDYKVEDKDAKRNITITDSYAKKYVFVIDSFNNYKIKIETK